MPSHTPEERRKSPNGDQSPGTALLAALFGPAIADTLVTARDRAVGQEVIPRNESIQDSINQRLDKFQDPEFQEEFSRLLRELPEGFLVRMMQTGEGIERFQEIERQAGGAPPEDEEAQQRRGPAFEQALEAAQRGAARDATGLPMGPEEDDVGAGQTLLGALFESLGTGGAVQREGPREIPDPRGAVTEQTVPGGSFARFQQSLQEFPPAQLLQKAGDLFLGEQGVPDVGPAALPPIGRGFMRGPVETMVRGRATQIPGVQGMTNFGPLAEDLVMDVPRALRVVNAPENIRQLRLFSDVFEEVATRAPRTEFGDVALRVGGREIVAQPDEFRAISNILKSGPMGRAMFPELINARSPEQMVNAVLTALNRTSRFSRLTAERVIRSTENPRGLLPPGQQ